MQIKMRPVIGHQKYRPMIESDTSCDVRNCCAVNSATTVLTSWMLTNY